MLKYIIKRLLLLIPVVIGITLLIYVVLDLSPRDPVLVVLGAMEFTPEQYEAQKIAMGLDGPLVVRYFRYLWNLVRGDFGTSWFQGYSVAAEFAGRLPHTLKLGIFANLLSIVVGIPLGIIAGARHNKITDFVLTFISLILASAPTFWVGMLGQVYLCVKLGLLPVSGATTFVHYILPSAVVAGMWTAQNLRTTRTWLIDVIHSDYVRTARAKGASELTVIVKHALRNALLPVVTTLGAHFAMIMGILTVIEIVFAIPGVSSFLINAVRIGDVPIVMGCILIIAVFVGVVNLLVDLVYAVIDPRVKFS